MNDERDLLERELHRFEPRPGLTDRVYRRRDRQRRNQRIGAGALAFIVVLVGVVALTRAFLTAERPAVEPTPRPIPGNPGDLAYAVEGDIYVAEWDGSNAVRIADGRPADDCGGLDEYHGSGPIWSPDGRYLAYRHTDCDGPRDAWWDVVISDPRGNIVTSFPSEGWGISWSPDSTRVAVWESWEEGTIGVYGLDGVRQTLLTVPPGVARGESDPEWSRDGESLLIGKAEIPLDGSAPQQLPWADRGTSWNADSPDGSRVAYTTRRSFVVAGADGSNPQEVFGDFAAFPVWSPTSDRIAFVSFVSTPFASNYQLRVLDVATGRVTLVAEEDGLRPIGFSPEGDRILYARTEDGGSVGVTSLWSVNADGSDPHRLVAGTDWGDWLSLNQTR